MAPELTFYHRYGCHLCDDALAQLRALSRLRGFRIRVVDVDDDPQLERRYGDKVPVLEADGRELCRYHLDEAAVSAWLSSSGAEQVGAEG